MSKELMKQIASLETEVAMLKSLGNRIIEAGTRRNQYISPDWDGYMADIVKANIDFHNLSIEWEAITKTETDDRVLDCMYCHEIFPVNEMYSESACCEEHQNFLMGWKAKA